MRNIRAYFKGLPDNSRFYILSFGALLSGVIFCGLKLVIDDDRLFYIRLQEVYGLVAVVFLYLAVILTPISKVVSDKKYIVHALFARRAIGVSAALYSLLHITVAVWAQFGGIGNTLSITGIFSFAFLLGLLAFAILFVMAATSFDYAIEKLTFPRWKQIHRFVYLAGVLILVHIWLIGTHADQQPFRGIGLLLLGILFGLEALRITKTLGKHYALTKASAVVLTLLTFLLLMESLMLLPLLAGNYHSRHHGGAGSHEHGGTR